MNPTGLTGCNLGDQLRSVGSCQKWLMMQPDLDFLTILMTEDGMPATKLITQSEDGSLVIGKIPRSFLHKVEEYSSGEGRLTGLALE